MDHAVKKLIKREKEKYKYNFFNTYFEIDIFSYISATVELNFDR